MIVMSDKRSVVINALFFATIIVGYLVFTFLMTQPKSKMLSFESSSLQVPLAPIGKTASHTLSHSGDPVTLKTFRGQNLVIHFWASWCQACETDRIRLDQLAKAAAGPEHLQDANATNYKVKMIGIASSDTREALLRSGKLEGASYPQFLDASGNLALALGVKSVPQTLLIDSSGKIMAHFKDAMTDEQMDWLRDQIERLASSEKSLGSVPEFELESSLGAPVNRANLDNKVWVADFIYTSCQGICPMLTTRLHALQEQFKSNDGFRLVSISVDPKTDRPEVLRKYQAQHDADPSKWLFLTGKSESVMNLAVGGFKLGTKDAPELHTGKIVLVDRMSRIRGYYDGESTESLEKLKGDVAQLLR